MTVEHHLPVTALFNCVCLSGSGVYSKSKVFQVQNQMHTCHPIGTASDCDRAIEKHNMRLDNFQLWNFMGLHAFVSVQFEGNPRKSIGQFLMSLPQIILKLKNKHLPLQGNWIPNRQNFDAPEHNQGIMPVLENKTLWCRSCWKSRFSQMYHDEKSASG